VNDPKLKKFLRGLTFFVVSILVAFDLGSMIVSFMLFMNFVPSLAIEAFTYWSLVVLMIFHEKVHKAVVGG